MSATVPDSELFRTSRTQGNQPLDLIDVTIALEIKITTLWFNYTEVCLKGVHQAWNYNEATEVMASVAPGLGLGAPSKVSHSL